MAIQANPDRDPITRVIDDQLQEHYRQQFRERFPQQIEQIMRLIGERLQTTLKDKGAKISSVDVAQYSQALSTMYEIHKQLQR
jgi:hypothetical protein